MVYCHKITGHCISISSQYFISGQPPVKVLLADNVLTGKSIGLPTCLNNLELHLQYGSPPDGILCWHAWQLIEWRVRVLNSYPHLLSVHDDVGVLGPAEDIVDTDDALLVVVLGVADEGGTGLHPGVAAPPSEVPGSNLNCQSINQRLDGFSKIDLFWDVLL